jgi:integrase
VAARKPGRTPPRHLRAPSQTTLQRAADDWLAAATAGVIRTRSGDAYKPSALRAYKQALQHRVLPALGQKRLTGISTNMLQDLADGLGAAGLAPSSIRNTILPLRAIYRRAHNRGEVALNPTLKLILPAVRGQRERVARPDEATALLAALPLTDRAIWATALYAGLRLGELQALDWNHIDLDNNLIQIERSWDRTAGFIQPKRPSGTRRVPLTSAGAIRTPLRAPTERHGVGVRQRVTTPPRAADAGRKREVGPDPTRARAPAPMRRPDRTGCRSRCGSHPSRPRARTPAGRRDR